MTTLTQITLPMPRLGETMERGTIAAWTVKPGTGFKRGDALLELETDKTLVEYPALGSGRLLETLVEPGDIVDVGMPIAVIETDEVWEGLAPEGSPSETEADAPVKPSDAAEPLLPRHATSDRLRATPLARRLARKDGIDLSAIAGTGRRGRIEARDVAAAVLSSDEQFIRPAGSTRTVAEQLPIYFVHGFAGLGSNWEFVRAGLQKSGLKSDAPDLPGHGRATAEAQSVDDMIAWLASELSSLPSPVHLVGHSLGAHVAAAAARRQPANTGRLTLVSPAGCGPDINGAFLHSVAAAQTAGELRHWLRLLGPKASKLPDDAVHSMAQELARGRLKDLGASMARGDTQCIDTISAAADLAEMIPVTAVFGMADMIVPKEHIFNMPPRVASHIVRTGHMPHWDAPALMEKLITQPI